MGRFETAVLIRPENLTAVAGLPGRWIDAVHEWRPPKSITLDVDSSESRLEGNGADPEADMMIQPGRKRAIAPSDKAQATPLQIISTTSQGEDPMKRIVICCDGTWNELDFRVRPVTNVVKIAQAINGKAPGGNGGPDIEQLVFYDEGVGTLEGDSFKGGAFGNGLNQNIIDAYTFLVLNYLPGDEIYIFGFSRGAYTARSLVGLIRNCGILKRGRAPYVAEAFRRYRDRGRQNAPNSDEMRAFRDEHGYQGSWLSEGDLDGEPGDEAKRIKVNYLGIWDTVGTLGVPGVVNTVIGRGNEHGFHDLELSSIVERARHAVAIDEFRSVFTPALWERDSINYLNSAEHAGDIDPDDPPFQQRWFPGDHGSVGGGGDATGLSDSALAWVANGANPDNGGLFYDETFREVDFEVEVDGEVLGRVKFAPTLNAPLKNVTDDYTHARSSAFGRLLGYTMGLVRQDRIGLLENLQDLHENALNYRGFDGENLNYVTDLHARIIAYTPRQRFSRAAVDEALPLPPA